MGYCPYHNSEKSGPWNGWYCNKAGRYVESDLYKNYCNSVVHCDECPIYDPIGYQRRQEAEQRRINAQKNSSNTRQPSYTEPSRPEYHPSPSSGGGGGLGCVDRLFFGSMAILFGGIIVFTAGVLLLSWLGFFREDVTVNLSTPKGVNPRDFTMEVISHDPNEDYLVDTEKLDKNGSAEIRMEIGANSVYLIYDDEKFSLSGDCVDGESATVLDLDYAQIQELLCRMLLLDLTDMEDDPVSIGDLTITDDRGNQMQWMPVGSNRIALAIPDSWTGSKLTLAMEGYEPRVIAMEAENRLEGVRVRLKPVD